MTFATQRRVISLNNTGTRGHFAVATGPVHGPKVPPLAPSPTPAVRKPQPSAAQQEAAKRAAAVKEKLKQLEAEEGMLAAENDEQYGNDLDEDYVEKRLQEIQAEKKKLQQTAPPPPPRP